MTEFTKETIISEEPDTKDATKFQTVEYSIYFIFGFLEILLVFRLILKLMGASISSGFVRFIYGVTHIFILPFQGIFREGFTEGIETTSVFEPSTFVAIIVYMLLTWGIVKIIRVFSRKKQV